MWRFSFLALYIIKIERNYSSFHDRTVLLYNVFVGCGNKFFDNAAAIQKRRPRSLCKCKVDTTAFQWGCLKKTSGRFCHNGPAYQLKLAVENISWCITGVCFCCVFGGTLFYILSHAGGIGVVRTSILFLNFYFITGKCGFFLKFVLINVGFHDSFAKEDCVNLT